MSRMLTIIEQNQILYHEWQGEITALLVWSAVGMFGFLGAFMLVRAVWIIYKRHRRAGGSALAAAAFLRKVRRERFLLMVTSLRNGVKQNPVRIVLTTLYQNRL